MALSSTTRPAIRGRVLTRLPATLTATGGLSVEKQNGVWTLAPDWTVLAVETTIPDPEGRQLWTYDPNNDVYARLSVQALIDNLPAGPEGDAGPVAGIRQTFDSSTTDSDPGNGDFRLNHATPTSATAIYLDNVDTGGVTVSGIIDRWDDSTNTVRGTLRIEAEENPAIWYEWEVTGSVVDGTGYRKVTVQSGAGSGTLTASAAFRISFTRAGNKGADGAGTGDVSSSSNFTADNRLIRSDRPSSDNKNVQQTGITVDDSNNVSGVGTFSSGEITSSARVRSSISGSGNSEVAFYNSANGGYTLFSDGTAGYMGRVNTSGAWQNNVFTWDASGNVYIVSAIELGHASDTTLSRSASGVVAVEGIDLLKKNGNQTLTGGFTGTSYSIGTVTGSNQTITPNPANGQYQHCTLNGSSLTGTLTFAVPSAGSTQIVVEVVNGGSGAVGATLSTSGYTKVDGTYATTNGNKYLFVGTRTNTYYHLQIVALQ